MRAQVATQIRSEFEVEATKRRLEIDSQQSDLAQQRQVLEKERESLNDQVREQVEKQRAALMEEAKQIATQSLAVEIADRDERLSELTKMLTSAREQELELRKQQRQLETEKEMLKLEVVRQVDAERQQLIQSAKEQFDQEHQFKQAEKDKTIADLAAKLKEMQRKVEQGSQQLQGEVQELALEEMLSATFPFDEIDPVGKGVNGGDAMQVVINGNAQVCGRVLWESKRTKRWGADWLAKARDDARESRSDCVVIVSEALPEGVQSFAFVEGVWVSSWAAAKSLATALRHGLIEVTKARTAIHGQNAKQELVYNYLAGSEFQRRVAGIAEAFITMQSDLEGEKRAYKKQWSKREKQLERAITNTASLYGDLQGIIGASLPMIKGLETLLIEDSSEIIQD